MKVLTLSSVLIGALASSAHADNIPTCPTPSGVVAVGLPDGVAPPVRRALQEKFGDIVLPGQQFDATDIVMTGKNRRFIFVWNSGAKWLVATEHGGRGYNDPIYLFNVGDDGKSASLVATQITYPGGVCSVAFSLINR